MENVKIVKILKIQGFHQVWYQGIVKATVFGVFEDLKFKFQNSWTKIEVVLSLGQTLAVSAAETANRAILLVAF